MKKKNKNSNVPIEQQKKLREIVRFFREPSSYVQHIALEKRTNIPRAPPAPTVHVLCCLKTVQQTQSSPNDNTANASTKKQTATSGLGLTSKVT